MIICFKNRYPLRFCFHFYSCFTYDQIFFAKPIFGTIIIGSAYKTSNILFVFGILLYLILRVCILRKHLTVYQYYKRRNHFTLVTLVLLNFFHIIIFSFKKFKTFKLFSFCIGHTTTSCTID